MISFGCISDGLFDKDEFPTLIKMVGSFSELRSFLRSIVTYFEWKRITLVIGGESSWLRAANDLSVSTVIFCLYTGPDGAVGVSSGNGLVGTGFATRYRLQPRAGF